MNRQRAIQRWWWRTRWLRTLWRDRALAMAFGLLVAAALVEAALRVPGLPLPPNLETTLFQCYSSEFDEQNIGYRSAKLGVNLPRPRANRGCAWDGYRWHHRGDALGYRNPQSYAHADVVLLGDSMVYGHGVEERVTAAHVLRQELGRPVANLGWTGDGPVEYLARLRNHALPLKPRVVVVGFFQNDLDDILKARAPDAIRAFVAKGDAPEAAVFSRQELVDEFAPPPSRFEARLLTWRALRFLGRRHPEELPPDVLPPAHVPPVDEAPTLEGAERLAVDYLDASTALMAQSCRAARVKLVFTVLPALGFDRRMQVVRQRVHARARALGVPFLDLVGAFAVDGKIDSPGDFLPHDGHLSAAGHLRVAREIASFLRAERWLDTP